MAVLCEFANNFFFVKYYIFYLMQIITKEFFKIWGAWQILLAEQKPYTDYAYIFSLTCSVKIVREINEYRGRLNLGQFMSKIFFLEVG